MTAVQGEERVDGPAESGGGRAGAAAPDRSRPPRPRPLHRYGQNHLVDDNILRAIVDQAAVRADDVVLEVGAADGRLTRPLLGRARLVHAFEIDRRFVPQLERLAAQHTNLRVHVCDALRCDLASLDPVPTALVANLAYNIAIPLLMTTIATLPGVKRWAVMVQRELGDRLFAKPSTKAYAAVSVLTQVACRLDTVRSIPPSAFRPRPRVESSFVTFHRRRPEEGIVLAPEDYAAFERLVRLAFGQRRKVLANTLVGARPPGSPAAPGLAGCRGALTREAVRAALERLGASPAARPEELSPEQWVAFSREVGWLPQPPLPSG